MKEIHRGYQCINKYQARARNSVWCIDINKEIENMVINLMLDLSNIWAKDPRTFRDHHYT